MHQTLKIRLCFPKLTQSIWNSFRQSEPFFQTAGAFVTFEAILDWKPGLVPKYGYMKYLPPSERVDAEGLSRLDP